MVTGHVAAPVSSGGGSVAEQVASGWLAAMAAFQSAARSADANEPALLATTVGPMLAVETSYLRQMQASGELAVGPTADLGTPTVAVVSPRLATVTDCVYDAEVAVDRATGQPVVGLAGQVEHERFSSVMERTTTGWELAEQTAVEVTACPAS